MPKYIIERHVPGVHELSARDQKAAALNSNRALDELGPNIQWVHSYISEDTTHCVYIAEDESIIREHAQRANIPITNIREVKAMHHPTTAELEVSHGEGAS